MLIYKLAFNHLLGKIYSWLINIIHKIYHFYSSLCIYAILNGTFNTSAHVFSSRCSSDLPSSIDSPRNILGDVVRAQNTENTVLPRLTRQASHKIGYNTTDITRRSSTVRMPWLTVWHWSRAEYVNSSLRREAPTSG